MRVKIANVMRAPMYQSPVITDTDHPRIGVVREQLRSEQLREDKPGMLRSAKKGLKSKTPRSPEPIYRGFQAESYNY